MESGFDVIVVGGGIGGTAVGALLAHRGRHDLFEHPALMGQSLHAQ